MSPITLAVELLLPPASLALFALLALVVSRRWGRMLAGLLLVPLVLLSLPVVAATLIASLSPGRPPPGDAGTPPGAIVVLSADVEWTGVDIPAQVGALTLERERAGAALQRETGLPLLVTGGLVTAPPPVGLLMKRSMEADFGVPVQWVEARSGTTWENAEFSAPILRGAGVGRVYLVTHAWHMRRSLLSFRRFGIEAVPYPVRPDPWPRWRAQELIPRASAWMRSYYAIHEWVGLLAYSWRG